MNKNLLTVILILAAFLAPLTMRASTATELAATISSFKGGGSGSLKATATGNTVTVTGTLTGITAELDLNIDAGVTVLWQAVISTNSSYTHYWLITLEGAGTFNVAGGSISSASTAVNAAIFLYNFNLIISGGEVSASSGGAIYIYAYDNASTVTVSGGTVSGGTSAIYSGYSMDNFYDNSTVTISGTAKVQSKDSQTIDISGSVEVKDNAQVISLIGKIAIWAFGDKGTVTVSGSGSVQGAILTIRNVDIKDNAQVNGINYPAIESYSWVSGTDLSGIIDPGGSNSTVTISGTSKVQSFECEAISKYGGMDVNGVVVQLNTKVVVKDNAQVLSTTNCAISAPFVNVNGGLVFAYGNAIIGGFEKEDAVIGSDNFSGVTGTGVVIAWNQAAGHTTYTQGSSTDILQSPAAAKVQWDKNGESGGISYANGTNTGFIPLAVNVNSSEAPAVVPDATQPVGADGKGTIALNLAIPSDITLTGSFEIQFPEGMTLDEASTALALELSDNFTLSFTDEGNNTWLIEIKSNDLKSSTATEYRKIMDIAYTVSDNVPKGTYEATITHLNFLLDDDTSITEDSLSIPVNVERDATGIQSLRNPSFYAYIIQNTLRIESPYREMIAVYSVTGTRLYAAMKDAGTIEVPFTTTPGSVYIIKGSVSGTIKGV